jgi:hypothetical protein
MSTPCGAGALQTRGTCWFYTILNGFLLSELGRKFLWSHMTTYYETLTPAEKAFFTDRVSAPCPVSATNFKKLFFYKFLDQYMCAINTSSNVNNRAGKSAELLRNIEFIGARAKQFKGLNGASASTEIDAILKRLGIHDWGMGLLDRPVKDDLSSKNMIILSAWLKDKHTKLDSKMTVGSRVFLLSHAEVKLSNKQNDKLGHSIVGVKCGGEGYLYDAHQAKLHPCRWWTLSTLKTRIQEIYGDKYSKPRYGYAVYIKQAFAAGINPTCHVRRRRTPERVAAPARAASPPVTLANCQRRMAALPSKTQRGKFYSSIWKKLNVPNRKILKAQANA